MKEREKLHRLRRRERRFIACFSLILPLFCASANFSSICKISKRQKRPIHSLSRIGNIIVTNKSSVLNCNISYSTICCAVRNKAHLERISRKKDIFYLEL